MACILFVKARLGGASWPKRTRVPADSSKRVEKLRVTVTPRRPADRSKQRARILIGEQRKSLRKGRERDRPRQFCASTCVTCVHRSRAVYARVGASGLSSKSRRGGCRSGSASLVVPLLRSR